MKLADISIKSPIMMTMVILAFVVLGLFSLTRLGIDMMPDIEFPFVVASLIYPGAGPSEMETLIAEPIEEEISSISGLKHVTSYSQESIAMVVCEFNMGLDVDIAAIDVKDKIDAIRYKLPADLEDPIIQKWNFASIPIIDIAVTSPRPPEEIYRIADHIVKPGLSRVMGIANVQLTGGRQREIQVHLSRRKLREFNLSPQMVAGMISAANLNIPAGHIVQRRQEITVRMQGEFTNLSQLGSVEIPLKQGKKVRLADLGWIEDSFKEVRDKAAYNGETSVGLSLIKRSDANTVQVARDVYKELEVIRRDLPADVKIDIARDRSKFIQDSVDDVFNNIIVGAVLTALALFLFLHSLPATVISIISIPTSIIATFILVDFAGFTLNTMTLMALSISVGILTANSIVVLENIERYKQMGYSSLDAASKGASEIAIAVAAATMTNVVVFTPMAFMSGIVGQFFKQFGLTVTFATLFSLLVSFTLTPMMASRPIRKWIYVASGLGILAMVYWRLGTDTALVMVLAMLVVLLAFTYGWQKKFAQAFDKFFDGLTSDYKNSLRWAITHRWTTLGIVALLFFGSFLLLSLGFIGTEFFPQADQGNFTASIEMPVGMSLDETDRIVMEVARRITRKPYVKSVYASSGKTEASGSSTGEGVNLGMVIVRMVEKDLRPLSTAEFIRKLRPELADLPNAKIVIRESSMFGGGQEADLQVEVIGQNIDQLVSLTDSVKAYMQHVGGLINIETNWKLGKPELQVIPKRNVISDQGLSLAAVGMTLRSLIDGAIASKFREKGEEYDIRVKLDPADIQNTEQIKGIYVQTDDRQALLSELVDLTYTEGPTTITHKDKQRVVYVFADVGQGAMGDKVKQMRTLTDKMQLPTGYSIHYGGEAEHMAESFAQLFKALILAVILTYMLMAAMLESFKHPFAIIFTLPLGFIGVLLALFITGNTISMMSLMAMVMLVGIVVNNGILLIDFANQKRRQGFRLDAAILEAAPVRLRPIIMTNLAAVMGMLPSALGLGAGAEFRAPLAIVAIGGLISSTIFTIYLIPVIYRLFEKENESI